MRSDAALFSMTNGASLEAVLSLLAAEPGVHTAIAGGTELMVALNTGRLQSRSLISLHGLRELRFIRETPDAIEIGAGTTFTDLRRSEIIARELPLLAQSAGWTGSIANQNRGTLGGNICNGSPAADNPPALLVYDASVTLVSASGSRVVPYAEFHTGYKRSILRQEELLHTVTIPKLRDGAKQYIRKVGTRNAQAISKVALAAVAWMDGSRIAEVRVAAASLADRPVRCVASERALTGNTVGEATIGAARAALTGEAKPIDDIRSTANYRAAVAANLLEEFLRTL